MLSVRDLVKIYPGPVTALQGVSLDLGEGMFGLLGPNRGGKATFVRILSSSLSSSAASASGTGRRAGCRSA